VQWTHISLSSPSGEQQKIDYYDYKNINYKIKEIIDMKTIFKLGSIEVQGVKINDIEVTQEYTAKEAIDLVFAGKSFVKSLIKELPEMLEDLEVVSNKFNGTDEIDERIESRDMTNELENFIKEINKNEDNCPFKVVGITRRG
jgi:hypothetical protein